MPYDHRGQTHVGNIGLFDDYEDYETEREQEKREKRRQKQAIRRERKAAKKRNGKGFRSRLARLFGRSKKKNAVPTAVPTAVVYAKPVEYRHQARKSSFGCSLGYEPPPPLPGYPYAKEAVFPQQSLFLQELGVVKIQAGPDPRNHRTTQVWHERA